MKTIDVTTIMGTELKSRASARDFARYLQNMQIREAIADFSRVNSVTRSFMDEFYQLLLKENNSAKVKLHLQNISQQTQAFLEAVKFSSNHPRAISPEEDARFVNLDTVEQLHHYLASIQ